MQDILTEAEAKKRWCPIMQAKNPLDGDVVLCIASDCMAWRLAHKDAADGTERGYCGAFGEPKFT